MIPKTQCPHCNNILWDDKTSGHPTNGDIAICVFCGEISIFNDDLTLRKTNSKDNLSQREKNASNFIKEVLKFGVDVNSIFQKSINKTKKNYN
jgi:hypothetical protein